MIKTDIVKFNTTTHTTTPALATSCSDDVALPLKTLVLTCFGGCLQGFSALFGDRLSCASPGGAVTESRSCPS